MSNGAQALVRTLINSGVTACFTNPGTSEMHFVAALDSAPEMRAVLTLFEGVATGAADGYARMADKPAATLLHLGCGLGNGLANLHNARKARVPIVNIVGDHATSHVQYDAQLQSDIETVARNVSPWVRTASSTATLCQDAVEAVAAAMSNPREVATLILPADVSWGEGGQVQEPVAVAPAPVASSAMVSQLAKVLGSGGKIAILLGGNALREPALMLASRIAQASGASLHAEVFPTRMERGAGLPYVERIAYLAELASVQLAGLEHLILVDAKAPVSFFAYPGKQSYLVPDGCTVHTLAGLGDDVVASLQAVFNQLPTQDAEPQLLELNVPARPTGGLSADKVCQAIAAVLPHNAIVSDEAQTSGVTLSKHTAHAPRHDLLTLTGGAIGQGLPVAVGAAIACPDRQVFALVGDGSAMYTIQALWTMAREQLNIITVVFNNRSYAILNIELERVGADTVGPIAKSQLDLSTPPLDFVALGNGMGVHSVRAATCEQFNTALDFALSHAGPHLIEVIVPNAFSGLKLKVLPHVLGALAKLPQPVARLIKRKISP